MRNAFSTLFSTYLISVFTLLAYLSAAPASGSVAPAISLTDNALKHLNKMRSERNENLCLRIGVRQGGCSGMSYTMDFEDRANARPDDSIIEYEGFEIGMIHILFLLIHKELLISWFIQRRGG